MENIIDIHTHLFNLKYLPVAGILVRYGNGHISENIAFTLEHFLIKNTKSIFDREEAYEISELHKPITERLNMILEKGDERFFYNLDYKHIKNGILNDITEFQIVNPIARKGLEEFQEIALSEGLISKDEIIDFTVFDQRSYELSAAILLRLLKLIEKLIDWVCSKVEKLANYFKWFRFMQKSEEEILHYLMTKDEAGVNLYIHHMMDVDYYFNSLTEPRKYLSHFDFKKEQINNMHQLNQKYKDKIYAFIAFDPSKSDCLTIVEDAIKNKGFKGVKFYPPMGYKAFNDDRFKKNIESLFDFCIENDTPIFTHCNKEGFESSREAHTGHNSNPMFWYKILLQENSKYKKLRLCLAHAGGVEGWFASNDLTDEIKRNEIKDLPDGIDEKQTNWNSSYAKIVYKLCLEFENVYCDAAYLDEITDEAKYLNLKNRLVNLFKTQSSFSKKIMYGSDWHMLFQEGKNQQYIIDYKKLFNEVCFTKEQREDFFRNNTLSYLKISKQERF